MEEFKHLGIWWLPETPNRDNGGLLEFSFKTGLRLQLSGTLDDYFEKWGEGEIVKPLGGFEKDYQIIHGLTVDKNYKITLLYSQQLGYKLSMPGIFSETVYPRFALIGEHFTNIEDIQFSKAVLEYSLLDEWATSSGFQVTLARNEESKKFFEDYQLKYKHPEDIHFNIDDLRFSIKFNLSAPIFIKRKMILNESTILTIEESDQLCINDWLTKYIFPLRNFFSLATSIPNDVSNIFLYKKGDKNSAQLLFGQKIYGFDESKTHHIENKLFVLSDIDDLSTCFSNWFKFNELFEEVSNLYFNIVYSPELDFKNQFLNLVQAMEIYHRIKYVDHKRWTEEEFKNKKEKIINQLSPEDQEFVANQMRYANEPNLQERLIKIINDVGTPLIPLMGKVSEFTDRIAKTRNYLNHNNPKIKKYILTGVDRYWAMETLLLLLKVCFLSEIGFSPELIEKIIKRNVKLKNILSYGKVASYR